MSEEEELDRVTKEHPWKNSPGCLLMIRIGKSSRKKSKSTVKR